MVSSNTSTIPLSRLIEGHSKTFGESFVITHFFNPPRIIPLVEVVSGPATAPGKRQMIEEAGEEILGKTVLKCRDTPGFVANRVGCFWIAMAIIEALEAGLPIEEADAIVSRPLRIPASGAFGLLDLIGVDLVPHVWGSLHRQLPKSDLLQSYDLNAHPLIKRMIEANRLGRKSGSGFYRLSKSGSGRTREVLDPVTFDYRAEGQNDVGPRKGFGLKQLCESSDAAGRLAWRVLSRTVVYASSVAPEIADTIADIDLGMRLGYNWTEGPFQLADSVGAGWIAKRLGASGESVPPLLAEGGRGRRLLRERRLRPGHRFPLRAGKVATHRKAIGGPRAENGLRERWRRPRRHWRRGAVPRTQDQDGDL